MKRIKLRKPLKEFAERQEEILRENDHKSWKECTLKELWRMALRELMELHDAIYDDDYEEAIIKECCDVANYMMMITDLNKVEEDK